MTKLARAKVETFSVLMDMTPRQLAALMYFNAREERHEMAQMISVQATAARGDPKEIKRQIKELTKD